MVVPISSSSSLFHFSSPSFSTSSRCLLLPLLYFHYQHDHLRTRTSQRTSSSSQERAVLLYKSRRSGRNIVLDEYVEEEEDDDNEEEDRSMDLFVRFVDNVYKKVSRRARKAVRSVLPVAIPTKLVKFGVNGALILAFLWVFKAFLQVVCTLGSAVFISILLIHGVWSGVMYFQETSNFHLNQVAHNSPA